MYEDTSDIVVFPPIFKIRKGEQRLVRLGTTLGPTSREGAYRVFVEELPVADPKRSGPGINLVFKVGIPLFVSPLQASREALGICLAIEEGTVVLSALNNDNAHTTIESVSMIGQDSREKEVFSKSLTGWYILSGSSRTYKADIPQALCARLARLRAVVRTERNSFEDVVEVTGGMWGRRPDDPAVAPRGSGTGCAPHPLFLAVPAPCGDRQHVVLEVILNTDNKGEFFVYLTADGDCLMSRDDLVAIGFDGRPPARYCRQEEGRSSP